MRDNKYPPIKSKPEETQRRKVMGLRFQRFIRNYDRQTTDNSKAAQKRRRKARHPKTN